MIYNLPLNWQMCPKLCKFDKVYSSWKHLKGHQEHFQKVAWHPQHYNEQSQFMTYVKISCYYPYLYFQVTVMDAHLLYTSLQGKYLLNHICTNNQRLHATHQMLQKSYHLSQHQPQQDILDVDFFCLMLLTLLQLQTYFFQVMRAPRKINSLSMI